MNERMASGLIFCMISLGHNKVSVRFFSYQVHHHAKNVELDNVCTMFCLSILINNNDKWKINYSKLGTLTAIIFDINGCTSTESLLLGFKWGNSNQYYHIYYCIAPLT